MRKRELQDRLANYEANYEAKNRQLETERELRRRLGKAIELLADRLGIRDNYLVEDAWDYFDAEQLVLDLLTEQQNGEVLLGDEARKARLRRKGTYKFDAGRIVDDLLDTQEEGEQEIARTERLERLSKPSKGSPEK